MNREKLVQYFIIGTFVSLYIIVSVISTIHVIDFFKLSNPEWLAISLAVAFEIGAAASLASLITLDKMNKALIWALFIILTLMQMMGNAYYAYVHLENYQAWIELFGLVEEEPITQKRILAIISGAILPIVALGFIKSLVDYIKPSKTNPEQTLPQPVIDLPAPIVESPKLVQDEISTPTEVTPNEDEDEIAEMSEDEYRKYIYQYLNELQKDSVKFDLEEVVENSGINITTQNTIITEEPEVTESENKEVEEIVESEIEKDVIDEPQKTEPPMNPQIRPGVN